MYELLDLAPWLTAIPDKNEALEYYTSRAPEGLQIPESYYRRGPGSFHPTDIQQIRLLAQRPPAAISHVRFVKADDGSTVID